FVSMIAFVDTIYPDSCHQSYQLRRTPAPPQGGIPRTGTIILYLASENRVISISGLGSWPKWTDIQYFRQDTKGSCRSVCGALTCRWRLMLGLRCRRGMPRRLLAETTRASLNLAERSFPAYALLCQTISEEPDEYS